MSTRILTAVLFCLALHVPALAQTPEAKAKSGIQWMEFDEALKLAKESGKHVMIDVYTDWCGYCKKLDAETYAEEGVRKILADSYVSIKLKGDSSRKLKVNAQALESEGKTLLQFVTTDTLNTTEAALSRGAIRARGYPTIAFLTPDGRLITKWDGYINAERFTAMINFVKDDLYEVMSFNDYLQSLDKAAEKS